MHTQQHFHDESAFMKVIDLTILAVGLVFSTVAVDADLVSLLIALGGAFAGSIVLAYFRRDTRKLEQAFKTVCATISGIVLGSAMQEYLDITSIRALLALYFLSGLLSLVLLRALFSLTEKNAAEICKHMAQRILGLHLEDERHGGISNGGGRSRRSRRRAIADDVNKIFDNSKTKEGQK